MTNISSDNARNGLLVLWLIGCCMIFKALYSDVVLDKKNQLEQQSSKAAQSLQQQVLLYQGLAANLSKKRVVRQALVDETTHAPELNRFLLAMSERWEHSDIYIANATGQIIASSNFSSANNFIGQNISFREYFKQAIQGQSSRFYGQGIVTERRGYFYAEPIYEAQNIVGIIVVKHDLEALLANIEQSSPNFILAGIDGIIFASSHQDWVYRSLYRISAARSQVINASLRYGSLSGIKSISKLDGTDFFSAIDQGILNVRLKGQQRYVVGSAHIQGLNWHLISFTPISTVFWTLLIYLGIYTLIIAVLYLSFLYQRKRFELQEYIKRQNQELGLKVKALTSELTESNTELRELVEHYQYSQTQLQETQDQLVQSAKLAVLGEMSAGVNHELNQPLMALKTYAQNSKKLLEKKRFELVASNLDEIDHITSTMHNIVARFKVFARKSPPKPRPNYIEDSIASALVIIKPLLKRASIKLDYEPPVKTHKVLSEPVQIEQVLVNLLSNAADAVAQVDEPSIKIDIEQTDQQVKVFVQDNGKGIDPEKQDDIFQPFFTTKDEGLGIGLAISKQILNSHNGQLSYFCNRDKGLTFVMSLNLYSE